MALIENVLYSPNAQLHFIIFKHRLCSDCLLLPACAVSLLRHHQLLGGHIYSSHQQRPEPHPLHADHAAFQRDHSAGMGELQTEETSAQRTRRSSSVAHLAGNVAAAREQPRPHHGGSAGEVRHAHQAHPRGKRQRWIQWHHGVHAAATEAAHGAVSVPTEANSTSHTHTHTLILREKWTDLGHLDQHTSVWVTSTDYSGCSQYQRAGACGW